MYLQDRYETQILDSFGLDGMDNELGGIYQVGRPLVNPAFPPLYWQTLDCWFKEPDWGPDGKLRNARITLYVNGILVQKDVEVPFATVSSGLKEGPGPGPLHLQDHGNPVLFNNVWIVEGEGIPYDRLLLATASAFPAADARLREGNRGAGWRPIPILDGAAIGIFRGVEGRDGLGRAMPPTTLPARP
jgi:hypothetical protein